MVLSLMKTVAIKLAQLYLALVDVVQSYCFDTQLPDIFKSAWYDLYKLVPEDKQLILVLMFDILVVHHVYNKLWDTNNTHSYSIYAL